MAVSGAINNSNRTRQQGIWPPKLAMQHDRGSGKTQWLKRGPFSNYACTFKSNNKRFVVILLSLVIQNVATIFEIHPLNIMFNN